jgi:hypothetical protein
MALKEGIRADAAKIPAEACPHYAGGWVFEPTEDTLHDKAPLEFPICFESGRRTENTERLRIRAARDLNALFSCLKRMGF